MSFKPLTDKEMPKELMATSGIDEILTLLKPITTPLFKIMLRLLKVALVLAVGTVAAVVLVSIGGYVLSMGAMGIVIVLLLLILMRMPQRRNNV